MPKRETPAVAKEAKPVPSHVGQAMPSNIRHMLNQSGEKAAQRLKELLDSERFGKLRTSDQIALMALAFNRAYGTPENTSTSKSVSLSLTTDDSDAVRSVMKSLSTKELPERAATVVDITPNRA